MFKLRVKEVAQAKGISQGKLARLADMALNNLRAIYRDPYKKVTSTTLNKLAKALDVPVTELLEDVSEEFAQAEKRRLEEQQHKHDSSTVDEN